MGIRPRSEDGMPLSDHERRLLAEIEQTLITDDRRFAGSTWPHWLQIPTAVWAVGAFLGLGCVVLSVIIAGGIGAAVAVVGVVLIMASCWTAFRSHRRRRAGRSHQTEM